MDAVLYPMPNVSQSGEILFLARQLLYMVVLNYDRFFLHNSNGLLAYFFRNICCRCTLQIFLFAYILHTWLSIVDIVFSSISSRVDSSLRAISASVSFCKRFNGLTLTFFEKRVYAGSALHKASPSSE